MNCICKEHSGLEARIRINEEAIRALWVAVNQIRGWVVAGMSALILSGGAFIINLFASYIQGR